MADGKRANTESLSKSGEADVEEESRKKEEEGEVIEDPYIEAIAYLERQNIVEVLQVKLQMTRTGECGSRTREIVTFGSQLYQRKQMYMHKISLTTAMLLSVADDTTKNKSTIFLYIKLQFALL